MSFTNSESGSHFFSRDEDMTLPELSPSTIFSGKEFVILGGTGFLGKIFWVLLLSRYPNIGKIHLMVRAKEETENKDKKKEQSSEERFWSEVASSEALYPLREQYGLSFEAFLREKISVFNGDLTLPHGGLDELARKRLEGKVAAVINVAGIVDFNPPLDMALRTNVYGVNEFIALCKYLGNVPLFHTSTCYVVGNRQGLVLEEVSSRFPFPYADRLDKSLWNLERELYECGERVKQAKALSQESFRQAEFVNEARDKLQAKGEPLYGDALSSACEQAEKNWLKSKLIEEGMERAKKWGWPNVYTYTKAMGEELITRSNLPYAIGRPACCESTIRFPFPGWNEGVGTSAPIIYLAFKGHGQIVGTSAILDFIPADMVASGMVLSLAELLQNTHKKIYHYGASDVNPATTERFGELIGLYTRKYLASKPGDHFSATLLNQLRSHLEPRIISPARYHLFGPKSLSSAAKMASKWVKGASEAISKESYLGKKVELSLIKFAQKEDKVDEIMGLFEPFTSYQKGPFSCAHTRRAYARLSDAEKSKLDWTPETIDWTNYWMSQHMPAMEKRIVPWLDARYKKKPKAAQAHMTLVSLLFDLCSRDPHKLAMYSASFDLHVTYLDLELKVRRLAFWLHAQGIKKGDQVELRGPLEPAWIISFFALLLVGAEVLASAQKTEIQAPISFSALDLYVHVADISSQSLGARAPSSPSDVLNPLIPRNQAASEELNHAQLWPREDTCRPHDDVLHLRFLDGSNSDSALYVKYTHKELTDYLASLLVSVPIESRDKIAVVNTRKAEPSSFFIFYGFFLPMLRGVSLYYFDLEDGPIDQNRISSSKNGFEEEGVFFELEKQFAQIGQVRFDALVSEAFHPDFALALQCAGKATQKNLSNRSKGPKFMDTAIAAIDKLGTFTEKPKWLFFHAHHLCSFSAPLWLSNEKDEHKSREQNEAQNSGEPRLRGERKKRSFVPMQEAKTMGITSLSFKNELGELVHLPVFCTKKGPFMSHVLGKPAIGIELLPSFDPSENPSFEPEQRPATATDKPKIEASRRSHSIRASFIESISNSAVQLPISLRLDKLGTVHLLPKVKHEVQVEAPSSASHHSSENRSESFDSPNPFHKPHDARNKKLNGAQNGEHHLPLSSTSFLSFESSKDLSLPPLSQPRAFSDEKINQQTDKPWQPPAVLRQRGKQLVQSTQTFFYEKIFSAPVSGREFIPHNRNVIVVANHASHLDMGLIHHALGEYAKDLISLAASDYFFEKEPWKAFFFDHFTNVKAIDRMASARLAEKTASSFLKEGKSVLIFPEGTRSEDGQIQAFKPMFAYLAMCYGVDLLPIYLGGTHKALPKGAKYIKGHKLYARIGPPLTFFHMQRLTTQLKKAHASREIARLCYQAIKHLESGSLLHFDLLSPSLSSNRTGNAGTRDENTSFFSEVKPKNGKEDRLLAELFQELETKFRPKSVTKPMSFYFTLGGHSQHKWTIHVDQKRCVVTQGKPENGKADCVLKTSPEMFYKMVQEAYVPSPSEFLSGVIKTSDASLLLEFQRVFNL